MGIFHGINGNITAVEVARPGREVVQPLAQARPAADLDLKRMAELSHCLFLVNKMINHR
jgi:hypothetical protein